MTWRARTPCSVGFTVSPGLFHKLCRDADLRSPPRLQPVGLPDRYLPMTIPTNMLPASHHAAGRVAAPTFMAFDKGQLSTPSGEADGLATKLARRDNGVGTGG